MSDWPAEARAFVAGARVARLATADAAGAPHVVPICFVVEGERLYTIVDRKPKRAPRSMKRLRNVAANPKVAVLVDRWDEDWSRLAWVLLHGSAVKVTDAEEYAAAVAALEAKYAQYRDAGFDRDANPLLRVSIERVVAWSASGR